MMEPIKSPPVDRFLNIPELLMKVLENFRNDKPFLAANTRVSKLWSEFALEYLWRDVTDLCRLFQILAPMEESKETGEHEFIAIPTVAQWRHFKKYSHRVRSITYSIHDALIVGRSAFDAIARSRTDLVIFPNLHTLHWFESTNLDLCVIFIHSGITTLTLSCEDPDTPASGTTLLPDPMRTPDITHLNLQMSYTTNLMDVEAGPFLSSLCALEELSILPYQFTSKISQSLSRLQNLRVVKFEWSLLDASEFHEKDKSLSEDLIFEDGAFPVLEQLSFCASFSNAIRFVKATNGPGKVESLDINSQDFENPLTYKALIATISTHYKNLTSLDLTCFGKWGASDNPPDGLVPTYTPFTIDVLRPLFTLSNLLRLRVAYWGMMALKDKDFEQIALAFPLLEALDFIPVRMSETPSNLTLYSMLPLAHYCPHLEELSLSISTGGVTIDGCRETFQCAPRMDLATLELGTTDTEGEPETIAFLLSWIFPLECELEYNHGDEEWFEKMRRLLALFVEVHGTRPLPLE